MKYGPIFAKVRRASAAITSQVKVAFSHPKATSALESNSQADDKSSLIVDAAVVTGRDQFKRITHSPELAEILADRAQIHRDFERTARLGHVPADALIGRLYANHCDELAEDRRRLDALEQALEANLRRLDALFPAPAPPAQMPPRPRHFRLISDALARQGVPMRH